LSPDHFLQLSLGAAAVFSLLLLILDFRQRDVANDVFQDCVLSVAAGKLFTKGAGNSRQKEEADIAALMFQMLRDAAMKRIVLERSNRRTRQITISMSPSRTVRKRNKRSKKDPSKVSRKPAKRH
jgi:hypothetical protein